MPLNIAQDFGFLTPEAKREKELRYYRDRWVRIKDKRNAERRQRHAANREEINRRRREYKRARKARQHEAK